MNFGHFNMTYQQWADKMKEWGKTQMTTLPTGTNIRPLMEFEVDNVKTHAAGLWDANRDDMHHCMTIHDVGATLELYWECGGKGEEIYLVCIWTAGGGGVSIGVAVENCSFQDIGRWCVDHVHASIQRENGIK